MATIHSKTGRISAVVGSAIALGLGLAGIKGLDEKAALDATDGYRTFAYESRSLVWDDASCESWASTDFGFMAFTDLYSDDAPFSLPCVRTQNPDFVPIGIIDLFSVPADASWDNESSWNTRLRETVSGRWANTTAGDTASFKTGHYVVDILDEGVQQDIASLIAEEIESGPSAQNYVGILMTLISPERGYVYTYGWGQIVDGDVDFDGDGDSYGSVLEATGETGSGNGTSEVDLVYTAIENIIAHTRSATEFKLLFFNDDTHTRKEMTSSLDSFDGALFLNFPDGFDSPNTYTNALDEVGAYSLFTVASGLSTAQGGPYLLLDYPTQPRWGDTISVALQGYQGITFAAGWYPETALRHFIAPPTDLVVMGHPDGDPVIAGSSITRNYMQGSVAMTLANPADNPNPLEYTIYNAPNQTGTPIREHGDHSVELPQLAVDTYLVEGYCIGDPNTSNYQIRLQTQLNRSAFVRYRLMNIADGSIDDGHDYWHSAAVAHDITVEFSEEPECVNHSNQMWLVYADYSLDASTVDIANMLLGFVSIPDYYVPPVYEQFDGYVTASFYYDVENGALTTLATQSDILIRRGNILDDATWNGWVANIQKYNPDIFVLPVINALAFPVAADYNAFDDGIYDDIGRITHPTNTLRMQVNNASSPYGDYAVIESPIDGYSNFYQVDATPPIFRSQLFTAYENYVRTSPEFSDIAGVVFDKIMVPSSGLYGNNEQDLGYVSPGYYQIDYNNNGIGDHEDASERSVVLSNSSLLNYVFNNLSSRRDFVSGWFVQPTQVSDLGSTYTSFLSYNSMIIVPDFPDYLGDSTDDWKLAFGNPDGTGQPTGEVFGEFRASMRTDSGGPWIVVSNQHQENNAHLVMGGTLLGLAVSQVGEQGLGVPVEDSFPRLRELGNRLELSHQSDPHVGYTIEREFENGVIKASLNSNSNNIVAEPAEDNNPSSDGPFKYLVIKTSGASPDTLYRGGGWPRRPSEDVVTSGDILVISDIHNNPNGIDWALNSWERNFGSAPALIIDCGDLDIPDTYTESQAQTRRRYLESRLALKGWTNTAYLPAIGNHDVENSVALGSASYDMLEYYNLIDDNSAKVNNFTYGPNGSKTIYSYNLQGIHFVCLSPFYDDADGANADFGDAGYYFDSSVLDWLEADLADYTDATVVIYNHFQLKGQPDIDKLLFRYEEGMLHDGANYSTTARLESILDDYNVDLYLHGHEHHLYYIHEPWRDADMPVGEDWRLPQDMLSASPGQPMPWEAQNLPSFIRVEVAEGGSGIYSVEGYRAKYNAFEHDPSDVWPYYAGTFVRDSDPDALLRFRLLRERWSLYTDLLTGPQINNEIPLRRAGPGGGGWGYAMAYHPTNPDYVIWGTDVSTCYLSNDRGKSWFWSNQGMERAEVYAQHAGGAVGIDNDYFNGFFLTTYGGIFSVELQSMNKNANELPPRFDAMTHSDEHTYMLYVAPGDYRNYHRLNVPFSTVDWDADIPNIVVAGAGLDRWSTARGQWLESRGDREYPFGVTPGSHHFPVSSIWYYDFSDDKPNWKPLGPENLGVCTHIDISDVGGVPYVVAATTHGGVVYADISDPDNVVWTPLTLPIATYNGSFPETNFSVYDWFTPQEIYLTDRGTVYVSVEVLAAYDPIPGDGLSPPSYLSLAPTGVYRIFDITSPSEWRFVDDGANVPGYTKSYMNLVRPALSYNWVTVGEGTGTDPDKLYSWSRSTRGYDGLESYRITLPYEESINASWETTFLRYRWGPNANVGWGHDPYYGLPRAWIAFFPNTIICEPAINPLDHNEILVHNNASLSTTYDGGDSWYNTLAHEHPHLKDYWKSTGYQESQNFVTKVLSDGRLISSFADVGVMVSEDEDAMYWQKYSVNRTSNQNENTYGRVWNGASSSADIDENWRGYGESIWLVYQDQVAMNDPGKIIQRVDRGSGMESIDATWDMPFHGTTMQYQYAHVVWEEGLQELLVPYRLYDGITLLRRLGETGILRIYWVDDTDEWNIENITRPPYVFPIYGRDDDDFRDPLTWDDIDPTDPEPEDAQPGRQLEINLKKCIYNPLMDAYVAYAMLPNGGLWVLKRGDLEWQNVIGAPGISIWGDIRTMEQSADGSEIYLGTSGEANDGYGTILRTQISSGQSPYTLTDGAWTMLINNDAGDAIFKYYHAFIGTAQQYGPDDYVRLNRVKSEIANIRMDPDNPGAFWFLPGGGLHNADAARTLWYYDGAEFSYKNSYTFGNAGIGVNFSLFPDGDRAAIGSYTGGVNIVQLRGQHLYTEAFLDYNGNGTHPRIVANLHSAEDANFRVRVSVDHGTAAKPNSGTVHTSDWFAATTPEWSKNMFIEFTIPENVYYGDKINVEYQYQNATEGLSAWIAKNPVPVPVNFASLIPTASERRTYPDISVMDFQDHTTASLTSGTPSYDDFGQYNQIVMNYKVICTDDNPDMEGFLGEIQQRNPEVAVLGTLPFMAYEVGADDGVSSPWMNEYKAVIDNYPVPNGAGGDWSFRDVWGDEGLGEYREYVYADITDPAARADYIEFIVDALMKSGNLDYGLGLLLENVYNMLPESMIESSAVNVYPDFNNNGIRFDSDSAERTLYVLAVREFFVELHDVLVETSLRNVLSVWISGDFIIGDNTLPNHSNNDTREYIDGWLVVDPTEDGYPSTLTEMSRIHTLTTWSGDYFSQKAYYMQDGYYQAVSKMPPKIIFTSTFNDNRMLLCEGLSLAHADGSVGWTTYDPETRFQYRDPELGDTGIPVALGRKSNTFYNSLSQYFSVTFNSGRATIGSLSNPTTGLTAWSYLLQSTDGSITYREIPAPK